MIFQPCPRCGRHVRLSSSTCPFCAGAMLAGTLLLATALGGCVQEAVALYGVAVSDSVGKGDDPDGDGYSEEDGDCEPDDPEIYPDATETADDGIDSNCDGQDNT